MRLCCPGFYAIMEIKALNYGIPIRQEVKGLKTGLRSVLWGALALLLLLSIAVPVLNVVAAFVMMVPAVVLYATLSRRAFVLHMVVIYAIAVAILGAPALIVGLFFLVPAIVMGHMYGKRMPARKVLTAAMLTLLGELLLELVLFDLILNMSLIEEMRDAIRQPFDDLQRQGMLPPGWTTAVTDSYIQALIHSMPMALITVSFLLAVITHAIARPALRKAGVDVPGLQPARDWMLPRVFVFYYLIVILVDLLVPDNGFSFLTVALLNLVPLMKLAFSVQAMGFFFFLAYQRRWPKVVPVLISVLIICFPPLSLIGVLDAGFPIRKAFKKP
jgi:uncharacterized protein YybS (DUF2232 family)